MFDFSVSAGAIAGISILLVIVCGGGVGALVYYRKRKFETELMAASWKIPYQDLTFTKDARVILHLISQINVCSVLPFSVLSS